MKQPNNPIYFKDVLQKMQKKRYLVNDAYSSDARRIMLIKDSSQNRLIIVWDNGEGTGRKAYFRGENGKVYYFDSLELPCEIKPAEYLAEMKKMYLEFLHSFPVEEMMVLMEKKDIYELGIQFQEVE
jgi:hypothetical protein